MNTVIASAAPVDETYLGITASAVVHEMESCSGVNVGLEETKDEKKEPGQ